LHTGTGTIEYRKLNGIPDNGNNYEDTLTPTNPRGGVVDITNKFAQERGWATREQYNSQITKDAAGNVVSETMDFKDKNGTVVSVHMIPMSLSERSSRRFQTDKNYVPATHVIQKPK
jgi:hypothetical protein